MPAANLTRLLSARSELEHQLPDFLRARRWFGGKARPIRSVNIADVIPFETASGRSFFLLVRVHYDGAPDDVYSIPLSAGDDARLPQPAAFLRLPVNGAAREAVLYDAMYDSSFLQALMQSMRDNYAFPGERGRMNAVHTSALMPLLDSSRLNAKLLGAEQSNSSAVYGGRVIVKVFRRLEEGINPELEIGKFLSEKTSFANVPPLAGYVQYAGDEFGATLAILQAFVPNRGDAWDFTLRAVNEYYGRVSQSAVSPPPLPTGDSVLELAQAAAPQEVRELIGDYLDNATLLGQRTAELHLALSSSHGDPAFDPEPFTQNDQDALAERALELLHSSFRLLRQQHKALPAAIAREAEQVLALEGELETRLRNVRAHPVTALRTRIHGDYHLGQVLVTADDFIIVDFEGEPARSLAERRRKRSPLQDVAGMLRSFQYAAYAPLLGTDTAVAKRIEHSHWTNSWQQWVSAAFLRSYLQTSPGAAFLPRDPGQLHLLLDAYLIEKALYELSYELNNRPDWIRIPLSGIRQLAR